MMLPRIGLRLRVAVFLALACVLAVAVVGVTLYSASEDMEDELVDQIVAEEMEYLVQRHVQDPAFRPQRGSNLQSYIARDAGERRALPGVLSSLEPGRHELYTDNDEIHVLVHERDGTRYYVAYEVSLHAAREREFRLVILLATLAAAVGSLALGYWLSGLLVRELTELSGRVASIRPGRTRAALSRPGQDAEIAMLAGALDEYQSRIELLIRREQEFTSNASHELRTPLTAIRTSCELLLADAAVGGKARARIEAIYAAAVRMSEQIQALLFLARGEALGETEPVAMSECVAEAVEPYRAEMARKGVELETDIAVDACLELNYQALRLVLGNFVRNAVQHTDKGRVRIAYRDGALEVSDTGSGIAPADQPRLFERFFRGEGARDDGFGLGLAIVRRICDLYGWSIGVDSLQGRGTRFTVSFG